MFSEAVQKTLDFLRLRKRGYQTIPDDVMRDLAIFCRANENAAVPGDDHKTWTLIGRREVWLRICQHRNLTSEQLFQLYGVPVSKGEQS